MPLLNSFKYGAANIIESTKTLVPLFIGGLHGYYKCSNHIASFVLRYGFQEPVWLSALSYMMEISMDICIVSSCLSLITTRKEWLKGVDSQGFTILLDMISLIAFPMVFNYLASTSVIGSIIGGAVMYGGYMILHTVAENTANWVRSIELEKDYDINILGYQL